MQKLKSDYYKPDGEINFRAYVTDQLNEFPSDFFIETVDWDYLNQYAQLRNWEVIFQSNYVKSGGMRFIQYKVRNGIYCRVNQRFFGSNIYALFYFRESEAEYVKEIIQPEQFLVEASETEIHLLTKSGMSHDFHPFKIKSIEVDENLHYNANFLEFNAKMLDLGENNASGIVLLHGLPGTGKTTYIKHLASKINRDFLFVTPGMADWIGSSDFNSLMTDKIDSVLVIEDAELILGHKGSNRSSATSNLLNITDGILSDCFNVLVICTFNTALNEIDPALLRPGRLKAEYKFEELSADRVEKLSNGNLNSSMTISEIYHAKESAGIERKAVGF